MKKFFVIICITFALIAGAYFQSVQAQSAPPTLNGYTPNAAQSKWVEYIAKEVVPLVGAETAARVTWWTLKEGVLDVTSPENPIGYSNCAQRPNGSYKSNEHIRFTELCKESTPGDYIAWQVGIAAVQVSDHTEETVIAKLHELHPGMSESDIIGRVAILAGHSEGSPEYNEAINSTGYLQRSLLLRDPAIGFALEDSVVLNQCVNDWRSWCKGNRDIAVSPKVAASAISELNTYFKNFTSGTTPPATPTDEGQEGQKEIPLGLPKQIGDFYSFALGIGGLVALGVLIFGGILYAVSAGNSSRQEDAKQWITGSIVGLIILFGSWFILNTINPELTKLTDLKLLANKAAEGLPGGQTTSSNNEVSGTPIIDGKTCPINNNPTITDSCGAPRAVGTSGEGHEGIDIFAPLGTPLYAMENGVIGGSCNGDDCSQWGWNDAGGWRFWLYGDSGDKYYYAHLYSMDGVPRPGTRVNVRDPVGRMGNTGETAPRSGGEPGARFASHLHLGWQSKTGGASCGKPSAGYHNPTQLLKALCESGAAPPAENPALAQVLNKSPYNNFGVVFAELGSQSVSINSNKQLQSASLYKLFVAKYLYEQREKGKISFDTTVDLNRIDLDYAKREDQRDGTPYPWGTRTKIPIKECLPQMISASENACGAALKTLARDIAGGESQINTQIGGNTTLYPQRTTAEDVANLLSQIAQGKLVNQAVSAEFERLLQNQIHQDKIPKGVPKQYGAQVGNKTGEIWPDEGLDYTNSHDAAIIRYNGKTYILVVLTSYNPADGRTNQTIQQLTGELFSDLK